jgi:hypothetical protein
MHHKFFSNYFSEHNFQTSKKLEKTNLEICAFIPILKFDFRFGQAKNKINFKFLLTPTTQMTTSVSCG